MQAMPYLPSVTPPIGSAHDTDTWLCRQGEYIYQQRPFEASTTNPL